MATTLDYINRRNGAKNFKTPQESFWAGEFGDECSTRVDYEEILASYVAMHADISHRARDVGSKMEFCVAEYYSPTPVIVEYRGYSERLFKRDFAGEILDRFPDLKLVDYGSVYHRDTSFPIGEVTWFQMEKC